jgi:hypothetical protein
LNEGAVLGARGSSPEAIGMRIIEFSHQVGWALARRCLSDGERQMLVIFPRDNHLL